MEHRQIRGQRLAVWRSGRGDRELVFVHGFQNDHQAWNPLITRLSAHHYRSTAYDLVGCGASSGSSTWERCTIDEYAEDLVALVDALELERPVVIGHSLGGATAIRGALARPGRFAGLVLIAPASTTGLDFLPDERSFESLVRPTPAQQRDLARAAFQRPPSEEDVERLMAVLARATPEHIEGGARSLRAFTLRDDLGALDLPTLLLCGDRDRHVPVRNHLATYQAIPRCGLQVYYDVGHVPFAETPDRVGADVERFLSKLAWGSGP